MFLRIVVLSGMIFSSIGVAQAIDEEDHNPWHFQLAMTPRGKSLTSIHVLTEMTSHAKIGISYSKGEDSLKVFQEAIVSNTAGRSFYSSDRLPYQMFAIRYHQTFYKNFWLGLSVGRLEVHESKRIVAQECTSCNIVYLGSTNGPAMDIDISKNYGSFSLGWQVEVLPNFSVGIIAFDYIFKGDSTGVRVNSLNGSLIAERNQLHAAMIGYARKDYFQPLQLMMGFNF